MSSNYTKASNDPNVWGVQPDSGLRIRKGAQTEQDSNATARAAAESLRDSKYAQTYNDRDNTHSGYGGHNTSNDSYGRDTSMQNASSDIRQNGPANDSNRRETDSSGITQRMEQATSGRYVTDSGNPHHLHHSGAGNISTSGMQNLSGIGETERHETGTNTGQSEPSSHTISTGINSGVGIHAQQYRGREARMVSGEDDSHHHHHCTQHGDTQHHQSDNEGKEKLCTMCAGKGHHASTSTQTPIGSTAGLAGATQGPNIGSNAGGSQAIAHGPHETGAGSTGARDQGSSGSKAKPSMLDKTMGGAEKMMGKMSSNTELEARGDMKGAGKLTEAAKN